MGGTQGRKDLNAEGAVTIPAQEEINGELGDCGSAVEEGKGSSAEESRTTG